MRRLVGAFSAAASSAASQSGDKSPHSQLRQSPTLWRLDLLERGIENDRQKLESEKQTPAKNP